MACASTLKNYSVWNYDCTTVWQADRSCKLWRSCQTSYCLGTWNHKRLRGLQRRIYWDWLWKQASVHVRDVPLRRLWRRIYLPLRKLQGPGDMQSIHWIVLLRGGSSEEERIISTSAKDAELVKLLCTQSSSSFRSPVRIKCARNGAS